MKGGDHTPLHTMVIYSLQKTEVAVSCNKLKVIKWYDFLASIMSYMSKNLNKSFSQVSAYMESLNYIQIAIFVCYGHLSVTPRFEGDKQTHLDLTLAKKSNFRIKV